jgi:hypothetical protein
MKKIRRMEITVETEEFLLLRRPGRQSRRWCSTCGVQVQTMTVVEAAALLGHPAEKIRAWVASGDMHFCETLHHAEQVCGNSALQFVPRSPRPDEIRDRAINPEAWKGDKP